MNWSDDENDFDGTSEYKYASEEEYLAQGQGCAINLQIEHRRATEGKQLEEIDLNVTDALETRACMLNAIFCVHGSLCDDEEHLYVRHSTS